MTSTPEPLEPPAPSGSTSPAILTRDTSCIRCSYNLVGLRATGVCPECGTPVEDSTRGFFLRYAAPEYIRELGSGLSLVLNGILLMVILAMASVGLTLTGLSSPEVAGLLQMALLAPSGMMLLGYWKYTAPDPGFVGNEDPRAARKQLRTATIASAALTAVNTVTAFLGIDGKMSRAFKGAGDMWDFFAVAVGLVGLVVWVVHYLSAMKYTSWVASRLPDEKIQKRAKTYLWLLPVVYVVGIGLGPLIALVMYWNLLNRVRTHIKAIPA